MKKKFLIFSNSLLYSVLAPENPPEDRKSGIRCFTGPDGPGLSSKSTGRTGSRIYKPAK